MPKNSSPSKDSDASLPAAINVVTELGAAGREVVSEIVGEFSDAAVKFIDDRKASASKTAQSVATILRRAAEDLGDESPPIAKYAERSGKAIEAFSKQLQERRWGDLVGQAGHLSEQRPAAFLLLCAGVGLAVGALLIATARNTGALAQSVGKDSS
jgi:hypothetical protein